MNTTNKDEASYSECIRLLKAVLAQVQTPCFENDPPEREHPQSIVLLNGDIRAARRLIAIFEDANDQTEQRRATDNE